MNARRPTGESVRDGEIERGLVERRRMYPAPSAKKSWDFWRPAISEGDRGVGGVVSGGAMGAQLFRW